MTTQMWLENLAAFSVQVTVLILAGTVFVHIFRLKTPVVLMALWQALLLVCLLLPVIQPWHHLRQTMPSATPPAALMSFPSPIFPDTEILSPAPTSSPAWRLQFPTYKIIALALGIGAGLRFLWLALGMLRLHRYRNKSRRLAALPDVIREVQWQSAFRAGSHRCRETVALLPYLPEWRGGSGDRDGGVAVRSFKPRYPGVP